MAFAHVFGAAPFWGKTSPLLLMCFVVTAPPRLLPASDRLSVGSGDFVFTDAQGNADRPITVYYHCPRNLRPNSPVLFVMHGLERDGRGSRDAWVECAEARRILVLAPEFSKEQYPGSRQYNLGNMFSLLGQPIDEAKWTFTAIDHLFDHVKRMSNIRTKQYCIYGHSAGAQFVHRLVMFRPDAPIRLAICANAGWYTMPSFDTQYPYGLKGSGVTEERLKGVLKKRLVILLGDQDTDENDEELRKTPGAMAQGKHRFERGQSFYKAVKSEAARLKVSSQWRLQVVPGVAHSNRGMSKEAARLLD